MIRGKDESQEEFTVKLQQSIATPCRNKIISTLLYILELYWSYCKPLYISGFLICFQLQSFICASLLEFNLRVP